jgi:hypothetical protein
MCLLAAVGGAQESHPTRALSLRGVARRVRPQLPKPLSRRQNTSYQGYVSGIHSLSLLLPLMSARGQRIAKRQPQLFRSSNADNIHSKTT